MKRFREENGIEVVYVQIADIDYLCKKDDEFKPAFIEGYKHWVEEASNLFTFIRMDEKEAVDFFKNADFIINFDDYKEFSKRELKKEIKSVTHDILGIADICFNTIEKSKQKATLEVYHDLQYKQASLNEFRSLMEACHFRIF